MPPATSLQFKTLTGLLNSPKKRHYIDVKYMAIRSSNVLTKKLRNLQLFDETKKFARRFYYAIFSLQSSSKPLGPLHN